MVICPFGEHGCNWEGRFKEYPPHVENCDFATLTCEYCGEKLHRNWLTAHTKMCPRMPKVCPLSAAISTTSSKDICTVTFPVKIAGTVHLGRQAEKQVRSLEGQTDPEEIKESNNVKKVARTDHFVKSDGATPLLVACMRNGELTLSASVPLEDMQSMGKCDVLKRCQFNQH